jgi:Domain of unknown function (DUF1905)/Bacteriocin-protection, YdeI or OmpD-Associated
MIKFKTTIQKFGKKGEKTGWSYIVFTANVARKLKPSKVSFRIKGRLDGHLFESLALLPMGEGDFILPLNATIRKKIGKKHGDQLTVEMELDSRELPLSADLIKCLKAEPEALAYFKSLPRSHQNYFSKWIESAKTAPTKARRIAQTVIAAANKQGYAEMLRSYRNSGNMT